MLLWTVSAVLSLAVVVLWAWIEWRYRTEEEKPTGAVDPADVVAKTLFFAVLTAAVHAVLDPDHDQQTFQLHMPQIARAAYAFAVTGALLLAFPTMRIVAGAVAMCMAVSAAEILQMIGVLPGHFRLMDWITALGGVAAAAGPMWIGAHRARRNLRRELEKEAPGAQGDKRPAAPI